VFKIHRKRGFIVGGLVFASFGQLYGFSKKFSRTRKVLGQNIEEESRAISCK